MNEDERVMAGRLVRSAPPEMVGYVVADANYDSNELHATCDGRGELQLVTPRRAAPGSATGHRRRAAGRVRSIELTEGPHPGFGRGLPCDRAAIERQFAGLTNWGGRPSGHDIADLPPSPGSFMRTPRISDGSAESPTRRADGHGNSRPHEIGSPDWKATCCCQTPAARDVFRCLGPPHRRGGGD